MMLTTRPRPHDPDWQIQEHRDPAWHHLRLEGSNEEQHPERPHITGKFLFFAPDKDRLLAIAREELAEHGFAAAKVSQIPQPGQTDHVLCLYCRAGDTGLGDALKARHPETLGLRFRGWKSDADTRAGKFSSGFEARGGYGAIIEELR